MTFDVGLLLGFVLGLMTAGGALGVYNYARHRP